MPDTTLVRRPRIRTVALVVAATALIALVGCEPAPTEPPPGRSTVVRADVDTSTQSNQPTAPRGNDVVMRVMDSAGKLKIAYVSFPVAVADTTNLTAVLGFTPKQSGFRLSVRNVGPFTNATTHDTRPALGSEVGVVAATSADTRQRVALQGVTVTRGRVSLALTTSSPYELQIVTTEGNASAAPALDVGPTVAPTTVAPTTQPPPREGWRLTWADEFDGTAVDTRRWNVYDEAGRWHSVESPKATTCPKASNVSVSGGILVLRTRKADGACAGGQAQSGAGLNTVGLFEQAQGRFEARARWTQRGNYLWGGFWTQANGGPGWDKTKASELDVFEYIGKAGEPNINRYKPAIHFSYTCNPKCMQNVPYTGLDVTAWHTYAVEWEPTDPADPATTQIRFFLDGVQVAQFDRFGAWRVDPGGTKVLVQQGMWTNQNGPFPTPFGPDRAHRIVLSAWVGAPGVDPATVNAGYRPTGGTADLQVDWVRAYQR